MKDWREALIGEDASIHEAIEKIDSASLQIALIVDEEHRLLGTATDGDIRRGILRGLLFDESVSKVMEHNPVTARENVPRSRILKLLKDSELNCIPILDSKKRVIDIITIGGLLLKPKQKENMVVLMAGGLGTRLLPLTESCPKPMLLIGGKPILEIILQSFIEYGFHRFYISVNYKAEVIEEYFKDGSEWGVEIQYLREKEKMGTAGSLSLLPDVSQEPIIVMNSDLLTKVNFNQFLEFHTSHKSKATMAIRKYEFQVPYGAVTLNNYYIKSIDEKPVQEFFVNAGMYVLDPEVLRDVSGTYYDMTSLFQDIAEKGLPTLAFPIREYWLDIGGISEYKKGEVDYSKDEVFKISSDT